jgi:large subunit ribosomal protein L32
MAVPKKRTPKTKRNMRRSHHARKALRLNACPRCGQPVPAHMACPNCGEYRGRVVLDVLKKLDKKERKRKEKARARTESGQ